MTTIKIDIFHYQSFLKGSYTTVTVKTTTKLGEIIAPWKSYFKNPNLKVFKFKPGKWAEPYTGNYNNSYFDENTTVQQYIDFYGQPMRRLPQIIFV